MLKGITSAIEYYYLLSLAMKHFWKFWNQSKGTNPLQIFIKKHKMKAVHCSMLSVHRYLILSHKIKRVLAVHVMESGAGRKSDVVVAVPWVESFLEVLAVHVADVGPVIDPTPPGSRNNDQSWELLPNEGNLTTYEASRLKIFIYSCVCYQFTDNTTSILIHNARKTVQDFTILLSGIVQNCWLCIDRCENIRN